MKFKQTFVLVLIGVCVFISTSCSSESSSKKTDDLQKQEKILSMYKGYKRFGFSKANDLTVEEILSLQERERLIFVDVRDKEEQDVSMISGAIPYQEFEKIKEQLKGSTIIAYCTIGSRSGDYTEKLMKEGYEAYNMIGSILSWAHEGQPLVHDNNPTTRAHVYGKKWDLLPEGYVSEY